MTHSDRPLPRSSLRTPLQGGNGRLLLSRKLQARFASPSLEGDSPLNANTTSSSSSFLVLLVLALVQKYHANSNQMVECDLVVDLFRLPTLVQPSKHRLDLQLSPELSTFSGKVKIDLQLRDVLDSEDTKISWRISGELHPRPTTSERSS